MEKVLRSMLRTSFAMLAGQSSQHRLINTQALTCPQSMVARSSIPSQRNTTAVDAVDDRFPNHTASEFPGKNAGALSRLQIGENVSRKDKMKFLVSTLLDLNDSKEAVYSALDAWVAWERDFPIGQLKTVLLTLEKEQQWHRIVQVIKWMLSKGQGNTMGTYSQLIRALDMDHRANEAQEIWKKKIGSDLHSVPWKLCSLMISVYYRHNMLQDLVKLFKGLEAFDRKPPEKAIVQKVADAYEMLGLLEEKERVLEKYKELFMETGKGRPKKSNSSYCQKKKNSRKRIEKESISPESSTGASEAEL